MYLIEGKPGTGKTTLALQFLLEGRKLGESTLYVTLSETTPELSAVAESHGWTLEGVETFHLASVDGRLADDQYTLYHPSEVELGETVKAVLEVVARLRPRRVVFDSLSEMRLLARDPLVYRRQILALKGFFVGRDCTVLLLDDHSAGESDLQLQSLCHGVILLEQLPFEYGRARRRLRVVKFRGVAATEGFHDFIIRQGGVRVFPQIVCAPSATLRPPQPLSSGIAEIDQLLGGGLTWGTTSLFIGPAGTGKSTIAAQFMAASMDSTPARVFLFDERRSTFVARCDAMGMRLSERLADRRVIIEQIEPGELSPGEFSYCVRDAVDSEGVRVVLIDSLNGYLNAIPQRDSSLARLHELLSYLAERNVATILVVAQHGIVGTAMAAPVDISYLADTVILLRFFEALGTVRRAVSVVKKRTGKHETTIREFQIGPGRVAMGGVLTDFHGVLTGVPVYTGSAGPLLQKDERSRR
jgi:circadian clock protein KaiC